MKKRTISLPDELLEQGLEGARRDDRSFSSYVQKLIRRDIEGALQVPPADGQSESKTAPQKEAA